MLRVISKEDFWSAIESGHLKCDDWDADKWRAFSIKQIQDAVLLSKLDNVKGADILEVGGGQSRTLPFLCPNNRCFNADPVEGSGHGPVGIDQENVPWTHVFRQMGDTADVIPDNSFDIVYSISVMEHVPYEHMQDVFRDIARVLRPGGRMIHLVDSYLQDFDHPNTDGKDMLRHLCNAFALEEFRPAGEVMAEEEVFFRGRYATNTDMVMHVWNVHAPWMKPQRTTGQACSFIMEATRT